MQRVERPVCWESLLLFALCTLDMLTSAWLFQLGYAVEANPLLQPFARAAVSSFIAAKAASYVPALFYLEWLRRQNPTFARALLRVASLAYACIYLVPAIHQLG